MSSVINNSIAEHIFSAMKSKLFLEPFLVMSSLTAFIQFKPKIVMNIALPIIVLKVSVRSDHTLRLSNRIRYSSYFQCAMPCTSFVAHYKSWWRFGAVGSDVGRIKEVTPRRARLVLGWVTVSGFISRGGKFNSV